MNMKLPKFPPINSASSRKEWQKNIWKLLLANLDTSVLNALLTESEKKNITMRAAAIERIMTGASYADIGKELWLSPQTISAIKKGVLEKQYTSHRIRSKATGKKKERGRDTNPKTLKYKHRTGHRIKTKYGSIRMPE